MRRYVRVARPWAAVVEVTTPAPARQYALITTQALRYGLPASRRPAVVWRRLGLTPPPPGPVAAALRRLPARPEPGLDELRDAVEAAWPRLAERARFLPAERPPLALLSLERASARTVFVLSDAPHPLLVLKVPRADAAPAEREAAALREAEPAGVGPLDLGRLAGAFVQEGLPGAPLRVEPLPLRSAAAVGWPAGLASAADGLVRLAEATRKEGDWGRVRRAVEAALGSSLVAGPARRALQAAWRDVEPLRTAVLRHHDTSAQNLLVHEGRLAGIIDWEMARTDGAPGFDVLNAATSWLDAGVGLARWSQEHVLATFERTWAAPGFWPHAREAARRAAVAGGVPEARAEALEVVFFGSRVGDRLLRPGWHPTTAQTAAAVLGVVA